MQTFPDLTTIIFNYKDNTVSCQHHVYQFPNYVKNHLLLTLGMLLPFSNYLSAQV
jgi:hypothetical protein